MFSLFKRKKRPLPNPLLLIELNPVTTEVQVTVSLPKIESKDEEHSLLVSATFAGMLHLLQTGELRPLIQRAVAVAGSDKELEQMANRVLRSLNSCSQANPPADSPLPISPLEVFSTT